MDDKIGSAPVARIAARYVIGAAAGFAVTKGVLSADTASAITGDGALQETVVGAASLLGVLIVEGFYWAAKRLGWRT